MYMYMYILVDLESRKFKSSSSRSRKEGGGDIIDLIAMKKPGLWLDTFFFSAKFPTVDARSKLVANCKVPYLLCRHDSSIPEYRATYDSARLSSLFYCKASSLRLQQEDILTMVQLTLHSKAVNLARRFSVQNEPDMMRA